MIHDCLKSYFNFNQAWHGLCNAHLIRALHFFAERGGDWAEKTIKLLLEAHQLTKEGTALDRVTYYQFKTRFFALLRGGLERYPPCYPKINGRRRKRGKMRSLMLRLIRYHEAVWAFATVQGAHVFARIRGFCSTARKQDKQVFKELTRALQEPNYCLIQSGT
jgi:transposase